MRNTKDITKVKTTGGAREERRVANMSDGHTLTISGADLVMPMVGLLQVELAHLTSQVIRGTGVEVPGSIN
jgi:hypothetical protein